MCELAYQSWTQMLRWPADPFYHSAKVLEGHSTLSFGGTCLMRHSPCPRYDYLAGSRILRHLTHSTSRSGVAGRRAVMTIVRKWWTAQMDSPEGRNLIAPRSGYELYDPVSKLTAPRHGESELPRPPPLALLLHCHATPLPHDRR